MMRKSQNGWLQEVVDVLEHLSLRRAFDEA